MPAPFAQPTKWILFPDILKEDAAVFGRVSVVQIASDSSAKERAEGRRCREITGSARNIFSRGSGTPMTPVEQIKSSSGWQPRRFAASAIVRWAAAWPAVPVAQLALPAFTTTPRMRPLDLRRFSLEISTGAATTRFCVKTAAAEARSSLQSSPRSSAPVFFKPHAVAAKRKPCGNEASESACFIAGTSAACARGPRKRPPILRYKCRLLLDAACCCRHDLAPSLVNFFSNSSHAARTDLRAVPPETDLAAKADSTFNPSKKSSSNAGECFFNSESGSCVHFLFTRSAWLNNLPTISWACRKGIPRRTR